MQISSLTRRFLAMLLDWVILFIPIYLASHLIPIMGGFILLFFYYPIFESSQLQATIGKNILGIKVMTAGGGRMTFRNGCLRLVMQILSMSLCFAGHIIAFFNEKRRAFHDIVAGTIVVMGTNDVGAADAWIEQVRSVFNTSPTP